MSIDFMRVELAMLGVRSLVLVKLIVFRAFLHMLSSVSENLSLQFAVPCSFSP